MAQKSGPTAFGKFISILFVLGLVLGGYYMVQQRGLSKSGGGADGGKSAGQEGSGGAELAEVQLEVPRLSPPAPFIPKDNTLEVEISEYAGYAGLIVANGGLAPSENSYFFRKYGFKVRLSVSEEESWSKLNSGSLAASVTTVDVLAAYGRQFQVVVPVQIGYSRGADGIVVSNDITRINALKGKVIATAQFTEVDFFIRYLAQEAGMGVHMMQSLDETPDPERINLVFTEDGFSAGDLCIEEWNDGKNRISGCVSWEPKTSEIVSATGGKGHLLTSNRNLLIVADILVVNRGFAEQNPPMVRGLAEGLLEGNRLVRDSQEAQLDVIAQSFKWTREDARQELTKVHFSNLPENLAFFNGEIEDAGSFSGIYQSAVLAYGSELIKNPVDPEHFVDAQFLGAIQKAGLFAGQTIAIAPIRSKAGGTVEGDPLLTKDIRFLFEPNSSKLDMTNAGNLANLSAIQRLLQVSPGSTLLFRGHVDNSMVEDFRKRGGDSFVRQMALKAMGLSKERAEEVKKQVIAKNADASERIEVVGRGWEEPAGPIAEQNRRVEVQWFTIE